MGDKFGWWEFVWGFFLQKIISVWKGSCTFENFYILPHVPHQCFGPFFCHGEREITTGVNFFNHVLHQCKLGVNPCKSLYHNMWQIWLKRGTHFKILQRVRSLQASECVKPCVRYGPKRVPLAKKNFRSCGSYGT